MSIFNIRTDVIDVIIKNNGSAYIWTESKEYETSRCDAESWILEAPKCGYAKVDEHHYDNGDIRYWFN